MKSPGSTYRVQLHQGFAFADAARITDYLEALGITHLYCSPYLQAASGSTHGYDVVDPQHLNAELGGQSGHALMTAALREAGAAEVHIRITCPPVKWPCFYGIDMPTRQELVAADLTVEEINAYVGADSLGYLSLESMVEASGGNKGTFCRACFDGEYPIPIPGEAGKFLLEDQLHLPTV